MQDLPKRWLTLRKSFFHYFYLSGLCCDDCCCCCWWWPPRPRPRPRWPPLPPTSSLIVYSGGWWQRKCRRVSMDCRKRCFHKLLALDSCHQGRGCCWSLCCCCCASTSEAAASSSPQLSRRPSLCQSWEVELQDQKHVVPSKFSKLSQFVQRNQLCIDLLMRWFHESCFYESWIVYLLLCLFFSKLFGFLLKFWYLDKFWFRNKNRFWGDQNKQQIWWAKIGICESKIWKLSDEQII